MNHSLKCFSQIHKVSIDIITLRSVLSKNLFQYDSWKSSWTLSSICKLNGDSLEEFQINFENDTLYHRSEQILVRVQDPIEKGLIFVCKRNFSIVNRLLYVLSRNKVRHLDFRNFLLVCKIFMPEVFDSQEDALRF